jgi:hypothetical protein
MKIVYNAISTVLVFSVFLAAPALGGEDGQPSSLHSSSAEHDAAGWERQGTPFSFFPAPAIQEREPKESRQSMKAAKDAPSEEHAVWAGKRIVQTPMSFSPAPPERHEPGAMQPPTRITRQEGKEPEPGGQALAERTEAPLGFFPVQDSECVYKAC